MNRPSHRWGLQQRNAEYLQRFNTYLLNSDGIVVDPQAVWDAPSADSRFFISKIVPDQVVQDPAVLSVGPFNEDRYIFIYRDP